MLDFDTRNESGKAVLKALIRAAKESAEWACICAKIRGKVSPLESLGKFYRFDDEWDEVENILLYRNNLLPPRGRKESKREKDLLNKKLKEAEELQLAAFRKYRAFIVEFGKYAKEHKLIIDGESVEKAFNRYLDQNDVDSYISVYAYSIPTPYELQDMIPEDFEPDYSAIERLEYTLECIKYRENRKAA